MVDKQEGIREGIITNITKACPDMLCADIVKLADKILKDEDSQGVVLKVERELPKYHSGARVFLHEAYPIVQKELLEAGCGFFEPLI